MKKSTLEIKSGPMLLPFKEYVLTINVIYENFCLKISNY